MRSFHPEILAACAVLFGAAACGGGETPGAGTASAPAQAPAKTASAIDACALLTLDEIRAATGTKVAAAKPGAYGGTTTCNYEEADAMSPAVSLILAPGMPKVASSTEMADWRRKQTAGYGDVKFIIEPVEGLGVPAIRNDIEGVSMGTLEVAVKGMLLDVVTPSLEQSKALAAKAMARLP
jgi:hypothetical protein